MSEPIEIFIYQNKFTGAAHFSTKPIADQDYDLLNHVIEKAYHDQVVKELEEKLKAAETENDSIKAYKRHGAMDFADINAALRLKLQRLEKVIEIYEGALNSQKCKTWVKYHAAGKYTEEHDNDCSKCSALARAKEIKEGK